MKKNHFRSSRPAATAAAAETISKGWGDDTGKFGDSTYVETPLQHSDAVVTIASVQPGLCLSGSKDMSVILYDYIHKRQESKWTSHKSAITKVCYGSACNAFFSSSRDKTIKIWQRESHQCLREFLGHSLVVTALHINSDNTYLCSGSRDNTVKLWDVESATCVKTNSIPQNLVTDIKFVPGSHQIVQTGEDKEVRIFDTRTLQPAFSFPKKQYIQMSCDVSEDGYYIASSSNGFSGNGCEVTLWDLRARKMQREFKGHYEAVETCLFLPGPWHSVLASASRDCSVKVWNVHNGTCEGECFISGAGPLTSLAAYHDGSILVGSFNKGVHLLHLQENDLTASFYY